jgi:hypothetical protein
MVYAYQPLYWNRADNIDDSHTLQELETLSEVLLAENTVHIYQNTRHIEDLHLRASIIKNLKECEDKKQKLWHP